MRFWRPFGQRKTQPVRRPDIPFRPNWTVVPGEILQEELDTRGLSQSTLARQMKRPVKTINEICRGKAQITPETAIGLEEALGIDAQFWLNLESMHRLFLAREQKQPKEGRSNE